MTHTTKHTPGPWNARRNHAETTESERINITAGSVLIAETHHAWIDWEEQEANAHLIAAAPAMYEALQDIESYTELGLNSDEPKHWEASLQDILGIVRDALAQAEGRHHE